jgi:hypothetical protein
MLMTKFVTERCLFRSVSALPGCMPAAAYIRSIFGTSKYLRD